MKINAWIVALIATSSTAMAKEAVQMEPGCETAIRTAVAALQEGYINADETTGDVAIAKSDLASVVLTNVKVLASSCQGPGECDAKNPDAFTYAAELGQKGQGLYGKVVVDYHRGNCFIKKISLAQ